MRYPPGLVKAKRKFNPLIDTTMTRLRREAGERKFVEAVRQASAAGPVRVNIGSGESRSPAGSTATWCGVPNYLDATKSWPVPDDSVDFVYADNVIEHIPLPLGRQLFTHTLRALKPGGIFRLATPDVEAVARQYLENGELARLGLERHRERGRDFQYPVQLIQNVFVGAKHYLGFCYDYAALSSEMQKAGFETTRPLAGQSSFPELSGLETRLHPAEEATTLIVEGRKPA